MAHKQIESYINSKSHYFSGVKSFRPVQNKEHVIDAINKVSVIAQSTFNKALLLATNEFSALFASIPHNKLKSKMRKLINFYFKGIWCNMG